MPIRINLLAEAQAAEELRRKDPVKRAIMMGAVCVAAIILVSVFLQSQIIRTRSIGNGYNSRIATITNEYAEVVKDSDRLQRVKLNMRGLNILASERMLYGNMLNALQKIYVDDVQVIHLRTEHVYEITEPPADKKDAKKPAAPATAAERFTMYLDARDASANPGDKMNEFKQAVSQNSYFSSLLGTNSEIRLANYSAPQPAPDSGRLVVQFSLEARPTEKVRLGITSPTRYAPAATTAKKAAVKKPSGPVKL